MPEHFQINSADVPAMLKELGKLQTHLRAKPGRYEIEVKRESGNQNAQMRRYYHVAMVELLRNFHREQGEIYSHDRVHLDLKLRFRKRKPVYDLMTGEIVSEEMMDWSEMSVDERLEYVGLVKQFLEEVVGLRVEESSSYFDAKVKA